MPSRQALVLTALLVGLLSLYAYAMPCARETAVPYYVSRTRRS